MNGRFPNLLVIGAMKAGTTSLHDYLGKHQDIYMSTPKEIHYYADRSYGKWDVNQYKGYFQTDKKYAGTSPQSYTKCHNKYYLNIPERIYNDTPDVKMIYIVRDPIERYKSHVLESYHCDPIEDVLYSQESGNYLKTSMYGMQLKAYLKHFELNQIHIMTLEDLQESPLSEMNKVFDFLGIDQMEDADLFKEKINSAETKGIPRLIKDNIFFRIGMRVSRNITMGVAEILAAWFFKKQLIKPQLSVSELGELKSKLEYDINEFRRITGKKFDQWSI